MKPTLLLAALSMAVATPAVSAKSELETLRALNAEQGRKIQALKDENSRLRGTSAAPAISNQSTAASRSGTTTYTVKSGDSFARIARRVGTTPDKLAKSNGLKTTSIIRPGQKLKVPGAANSMAASKAPAAAPAPAVAASRGGSYTIRQGDTFSSISKKHGVSVSTLIAANPKVKPSALRVGQTVNLGAPASRPAAPASNMQMAAKAPTQRAAAPVAKAPAPAPRAPSYTPAPQQNIPVSTGATASAPAPAPKSADKPAPTPPAPTPASTSSPEKKIRPVLIESEMTYGEFAAKYGTNADRLNALNGLDLTTATVLAKGSELYVPTAQP